MARNKETPLTFLLPDGDVVDLCTWDYIISILDVKLTPMLNALEDGLYDLQKIENKLDTWLESTD